MNTLARIQKELKAPKNRKNDFGKYNYRSCEDILEAIKPLLDGATLTISDEIVCIGNNNPQHLYNTEPDKNGNIKHVVGGEQRFYVKATATLQNAKESSLSVWSATAYARESLDKKGMDDAQITGTASSYARKYALNGLFCIDDTQDADAIETHGKEQPSAPRQDVVSSQKAIAGDSFDFK
jgi:hypothetical protein